jgi:hypothetical protein
MAFHQAVKESFKKAKEDAEGIKNEVAFLAKRIARIEEVLNKMSVQGNLVNKKKKL